jgi:very-short-patch-repair endonuclease
VGEVVRSTGEGLQNQTQSQHLRVPRHVAVAHPVRMRLTPDQRSFARRLRRDQTDAERRLWTHLRAHHFQGRRFRRQHPIGPYFADFACVEMKLVIELDGGQHDSPCGRLHDTVRADVLAGLGYRVLRFWDNDVLASTEAVLRVIEVAVSQQAD